MIARKCHCEESLDFTQAKLRDEAIPIRFLTSFGMTLCVRLLHGVYTEFNEVFAMTAETLYKTTGNYQTKVNKKEGLEEEGGHSQLKLTAFPPRDDSSYPAACRRLSAPSPSQTLLKLRKSTLPISLAPVFTNRR